MARMVDYWFEDQAGRVDSMDQAKKVEIFYCCQVPQEEEGGIWFRRESGNRVSDG